MSTKGHIAYLRAAFALVLPAVVTLLWRSGYLNVLAQIASERSSTTWLAFALAGCLAVLEWRLLVTLSRLVRARGRLDAFAAQQTDPIQIARRRRFRFQLAATALSVLLAFTLSELVFRVLGIEPPPAPPSVQVEREAFDRSVNALGIREDWDVLPEDDRRLRIAFLGDSITLGDNVEMHETFVHLIEEDLSADRPEGVVTINMGHRGTDPAWQRLKFLPLREVLRPQVVIQVAYPNDLGINMHTCLDEIYRIRDEDVWVGKTSYVLRFAETQIRHRLAWNKTIDYFRGGRTGGERADAWAKFRVDIRACKAAAENGGAVYALVLFPWLVRLDDYLLTDVHEEMRRVASELDVPYLDLLEVFAGRDAEALRVSLANEHPNAVGHRLAADRIVRFLREEVLPTLTR